MNLRMAWLCLLLGAAPCVAQDGEGPLERADALMRQGRWADAVALFRGVLAEDPTSVPAQFGLGTAMIELGDFRTALQHLEPLLKEHGESATLKNNLAWIYVKAEDPDLRDPARALALAQDAVLVAPGNVMIWSTLAEAYYANRAFDRALRAARIALRMASDEGLSNIQEFRELYERCRGAADAAGIVE